MTVLELLHILTPAQLLNLHVIGGTTLVYDAGPAILEAFVAQDGTIVPRNMATKTALEALQG